MTAEEYIAKLESRWPKNIPLGLLRDAVIVISRRKLQEIKAELYGTNQSHNLCAGRLCEYKIGTVDMANFEALVPGVGAVRFLKAGDQLVYKDKLWHVTRVSRGVDGKEVRTDITPVADITYLG
jgi:hypothetical protein